MKQYIELYNGVQMPIMAIGTNWMNYEELKPIVKAGLLAGFRAIDTARDYGNEDVVGAVIKDVLKELNISRKEIFITTKIGNSQQAEGNIAKELEISLKNLQTEYIDLWLMHWPYSTYYINTWEKMVNIYKKTNKVRAIGVANYQVRHFQKLLKEAPDVTPMVNQMEYHPLRTVPELVAYMNEHNIKLQAYAPLCRLVPPLKDAEILKALAQKYQKSIGQIILRWHIQQENVMPIFKSYKPTRFTENIDIFNFQLTDEEMTQISALNIDYKYHIESASCPSY